MLRTFERDPFPDVAFARPTTSELTKRQVIRRNWTETTIDTILGEPDRVSRGRSYYAAQRVLDAERLPEVVSMQRRQACVSVATLKLRGWTQALISRFLGEADATAKNPHYSSAAPARLYLVGRVEDAEALPEWLAALAGKSHAREALSMRAKTRVAIATIRREQSLVQLRMMSAADLRAAWADGTFSDETPLADARALAWTVMERVLGWGAASIDAPLVDELLQELRALYNVLPESAVAARKLESARKHLHVAIETLQRADRADPLHNATKIVLAAKNNLAKERKLALATAVQVVRAKAFSVCSVCSNTIPASRASKYRDDQHWVPTCSRACEKRLS
ncbi:MAG: hypothetical protein ACYDGM_12320 [Vulcanimicrobiaceae bacterium]